MVSPQPIETLMQASSASVASHKVHSASPMPSVQPTLQKAQSSRRLRRAPSFLNNQPEQPYLWALHEQQQQQHMPQHQPEAVSEYDRMDDVSMSLDSPIYNGFGGFDGDINNYSSAFAHTIRDCEQCWEQGTSCPECAFTMKQQQFNEQGWPVDSYQVMIKQEPMGDDSAWVKTEPMKEQYDMPMLQTPVSLQQQQRPYQEEEYQEEKTSDQAPITELPPLSSPLIVGHFEPTYTRMQGKLTRFLPEGQDMMAVDTIDPNYHTRFEEQQYAAPTSSPAPTSSARRESRQLRVRKTRSRSNSPYMSERSGTPESFTSDSAYETDQYDDDEQSQPSSRSTRSIRQIQNQPIDDTISPPPAGIRYGTYGEMSSGTDSSSEPPALNPLLPVSANTLLPSRPSTAAIPPSHIKDRLVKSARKLLTAADGCNDNVQVQVIPIFYPAKGAPGAHKIRLIRVQNTDEGSVSVYAHAADVGGVVERKSNISRLFGKFESPSEKLLMNVVGAHNHTVGQESNILTSKGVKKFLATNKMKDEHAYRNWINSVLLPKLLHDPLVISEEMVEIEASTDPNLPHYIKPKGMKRLEKKRERKLAEEREEKNAAASSSKAQSPVAKRQRLESPAPHLLSPQPSHNNTLQFTTPFTMHSPAFNQAHAA